MIDIKLQNHIIKLYDAIDSINSIKSVTEGYLSRNFTFINKNHKYFLKQYEGSYSEEKVMDIHKVTQYFSNNSIPTVNPLENNQGSTYFIHNNNIFALFPFVRTAKEDRKTLNSNSIKSLAKTLARIHLLSSDGAPLEFTTIKKFINREKFLDLYPKVMKILKSKNEKDSFDKLALEVLELKKSIVDSNSQRREEYEVTADHLLHGDYHEKNVFFDSNGNVEYVFDWDGTKMGDRLHELIRSMDFVCLDGEYTEEKIERAKLYIQSYNELYPFSRDRFLHAMEGYYLKKAHSLWIEGTHYLDNSDRVDCFLENELSLLSYFPGNYKDLTEKLGV